MNQDKSTYPHNHYDIITRINELISIIEVNRAIYAKKEATISNCEGMVKLFQGLEELEKLREAISERSAKRCANQIEW